MHNFTRKGGCKDQLLACQDLLKDYDAATINLYQDSSVCPDLQPECEDAGPGKYFTVGDRGWYDIAHPSKDPFPPPHMHGYLADGDILAALGSPVNFTAGSSAVAKVFSSTKDEIHGGFLDAVGYLLDSGVKVHMMYGDRDYACNWVGGEKASLAIPYSHSEDFAAAGYAPLLTPDGLSGMTRQFGNYSFSRVFQAGHEVPSYQPAAAYEIFMRATFGRDVPTGLFPVTDEFSSVGVSDTWHIKNALPEMPEPKCYVLAPATCEADVWDKVVKGEAKVENYWVVGSDTEVEIVQSDDEGQGILGEL